MMSSSSMRLYDPKYELPKAVASVRDWQQSTCQGGAVVSGLFAGVGSQLLSIFQSVEGHPGTKQFLLVTCYASILLNITATVYSFVIVDHLGSTSFEAAAIRDSEDERMMGHFPTSPEGLLIKYGASSQLRWLLYIWLVTVYVGVLSLIVAVLTYVVLQGSNRANVLMGLIGAFTLLPLAHFIFVRPLIGHRDSSDQYFEMRNYRNV